MSEKETTIATAESTNAIGMNVVSSNDDDANDDIEENNNNNNDDNNNPTTSQPLPPSSPSSFVANMYYQAASSLRLTTRGGHYMFSHLQRHDSEFSVSSDIYQSSRPSTTTTITSSPVEDDEEPSPPIAEEEVEGGNNNNNEHLLNIFQGAALLTADCLGTGILALPHDIEVLGSWLGIGFLLLNLPINLYAGTILSDAALYVEERQKEENITYQQELQLQQQFKHETTTGNTTTTAGNTTKIQLSQLQPPLRPRKSLTKNENENENDNDNIETTTITSTKTDTTKSSSNNISSSSTTTGNGIASTKKPNYKSISMNDSIDEDDDNNDDTNNNKIEEIEDNEIFEDEPTTTTSSELPTTTKKNKKTKQQKQQQQQHHIHKQLHHDTATFDFIGMTSALFHTPIITKCVMILFYTNIFLVLGDYILVMSHAVAALIGENKICIPIAGLIACTLMFAVSQLRTMSKLGRSASIISLSALAIVLLQCLYYSNTNNNTNEIVVEANETEINEKYSLLRKLSAMGSIGFAVGSQKLFLNIRRELRDRTQAPKSLAMSLSVFGTVYVLIVLHAGQHPPGFLFDAIPSGIGRQLAGFFLWVHVVVSYAINSQAICGSIDRLFFQKFFANAASSASSVVTSPSTISNNNRSSLSFCFTRVAIIIRTNSKLRWLLLTFILAITAFFVANAIPFFKDLVALIGALTSVPLTLLLPGIYHRQILNVPIWFPTTKTLVSYGLVVFSVLFMITALFGSIDSIGQDWLHHTGGFFSCE